MKILKLLVPMLCGLCFFCYSTVGGAVSVAAAGGAYTLTVEQTLALYGRTLEGTFYNKNDGIDYHVEFQYCFPLSNWRPQDYTDSAVYLYSMDSIQNNGGYSGSSIMQAMKQKNWLVYQMLDNASAYPYPTYSGSTDHSNLYVEMPFSVRLDGVYMWSQFFMWGTWYANENYPSERNMITNVTSIDNALTCKPYYYWYSSNYYHRMSQCIFPGYSAVSVSAVPNDESKLMYCSVIRNDLATDTEGGMSISSQNAKYNWVHPYTMTNWGNGIGSTAGVGEKNILIFIQCPTFSTTNPLPDFNQTTAPTSGTGIGSTASYETFPTVDLSALESGVGTMVQQIDEGNYYERIQIDQLNTIIQQLNDIYAQMVARGEIAVDLVAAGSAQRFDTSILDQVQNAATSYTIAQLPQDYAGNGATGIGAFIAQVVGVDPVFMTIGLFSIGFAIFCWFVFRGRGGV